MLVPEYAQLLLQPVPIADRHGTLNSLVSGSLLFFFYQQQRLQLNIADRHDTLKSLASGGLLFFTNNNVCSLLCKSWRTFKRI